MTKLHDIRVTHTVHQVSFDWRRSTTHHFESQAIPTPHFSNLVFPNNNNFYEQLIFYNMPYCAEYFIVSLLFLLQQPSIIIVILPMKKVRFFELPI